MGLSYLKDSSFLRALNNEQNKIFYVKIIVLNKEELPVSEIEGRITSGSSLNIDGNSNIRRTCSLTFVAEETENDLTDVDNLLSMNKKIKISVGFENSINLEYDPIIWFPLGVFVICQPAISHSLSGVTISLSCKDKMCLLNGELGGTLPTSVTFDEYDQLNEDGSRTSKKQLIYDIIQTLVCNYGGEPISKIFINDILLELKQIVRYTGSNPLYYNSDTDMYTTNQNFVTEDGAWKTYSYNEDVGYIYTDFVYPGELVSGIGDNVCSVLDKIKTTLGNYEYFYDIEGNFIFQEIKNYLNNSYDPTNEYRLDNNRKVQVQTNNLTILDDTNFEVDFNSNTKSVYTFDEDNGLIISYSNTPQYANIKNDFHIWGKNDGGFAIHYHLAVKEKPNEMNRYQIVYSLDKEGDYDGGLRLASAEELSYSMSVVNGIWKIPEEKQMTVEKGVLACKDAFYDNGVITFATGDLDVVDYTPEDWRAEIYLRGLKKQSMQIRPDIYEQELLDLFDTIYDFKARKFKSDIVNRPNELNYFIDYLEPIGDLADISVNSVNLKSYAYQQDKVNKLYNNDIPDVILINLEEEVEKRIEIINHCELEGQPYANISDSIYSNLSIGTTGYTAQETARDLLYQYTSYNNSISLSSIPIYYLDVNSRITVNDRASNIYGDYIIKSISLPFDAKSTMSISATKALERF